jgi:hypothetical protein
MDGDNIASTVAKKKLPRSVVAAKEQSERITREYSDYLKGIATNAKLSAYALEKTVGLDRKAALRVWNFEQDERGHTPSIASAARVRQAMVIALKDETIAPPSVSLVAVGGDHLSWIEAGALLRQVRPEAFQHLLAVARAAAKKASALDQLTSYLIDTLGQLAARISATPNTDPASQDKAPDVE